MHPVRIGHYLIDRKIGSGGMGNVYLARHEETGEVVAVKELPASMAREEGFVHRFSREIEAMQKLNCPNIVKLIESGSDDGTYFYSMEYIDGETLTSRLRRERKIPWEQAVELARQICMGLKHAHDAGVVHRDLKPSNLMLTKDGTVKIADFGVAQVFAADRLTLTGGVIGTAEFMSPEQVTGSRADKRSDLYSLGAVLYTMIVGQPPFLGATASDIMQKQRFGRFDPPKSYVPEIPGWLNDLICQLLEKEPDKRPRDAFVTARRLADVSKKIVLHESAIHVGPSDETRADSGDAGPHVGATFVRDLLRVEATREEPTTLVAKAMNNTWVLLAMLLLIVVGAGWLLTRADHQVDLVDEDVSVKTEGERIVQRARWSLQRGDPIAGLIQLDALESIVRSDPTQKKLLAAIDQVRRAIRKQMNTPNQMEFVEDALNRADELVKDHPENARSIYEGIVTLYRDDRRLETFVDRARRQLQILEGSSHEKSE